jgi:hypothetical protein
MTDPDRSNREVDWPGVFRDPLVTLTGALVVLTVVFNALLLFGGLSGGGFWLLWSFVLGATVASSGVYQQRRKKR